MKCYHFNGFVQERCNSSANALELHLLCTNPSILFIAGVRAVSAHWGLNKMAAIFATDNFNGIFWMKLCELCESPVLDVDAILLGRGLLSQFSPFCYFPNFSASPKYMLAIVYRVPIWQVLPQLSCGDTCQIWMWCKWSNRYFDRIENFAYGEINERSFSNPHPWDAVLYALTNQTIFKWKCLFELFTWE